MLTFEGVEVKEASGFFGKLVGLMFKKNIKHALLFKNCRSIHTFFMMEAIDVVVTNKDDEIIKTYKNVKPFRILVAPRKTKNVYELPKGTLK